jgi:hypothetical protein
MMVPIGEVAGRRGRRAAAGSRGAVGGSGWQWVAVAKCVQ